MSLLYMTSDRRYAVVVGQQGTYDILEVDPPRPEREWANVGNRDWLDAAKSLADTRAQEAQAL